MKNCISLLAALFLYFSCFAHAGADEYWDAVGIRRFAGSEKRLDQPVTVLADAWPLRRLIGVLAKRSGVALDVDEQIAEHRVTINVKNTPLVEVLDNLIVLLTHSPDGQPGFVWEKQPQSAGAGYTLYQTSRNREYEVSWRNPRAQRLKQCLTDIIRYLHLSPEEKLKFESPFPIFILAKQKKTSVEDSVGIMFEPVYGLLSLSDIDRLVQGESIVFPQNSYDKTLLSDLTAQPVSDDEVEGLQKKKLHFNIGDAGWVNTSGLVDLSVSLIGTNSARGLVLDLGEPLDLSQRGKLPDIEIRLRDGLPNAKSDTLESDVILPCRLLAERFPMPFYAEVFYDKTSLLNIGKAKLRDVMDQLNEFHYTSYEVKNGACFVRSRAWAEKRYADVPEPQIEKWCQSKLRNGRLTLLNMIEMAHCRDEQAVTLKPVFNVAGPLFRMNIDMLRFMYGMRERELRETETKEGLPITLSGEQMDLLARVVKVPYEQPLVMKSRVAMVQGVEVGDVIRLYDANGKEILAGSVMIKVDKPGLNYAYLAEVTREEAEAEKKSSKLRKAAK